MPLKDQAQLGLLVEDYRRRREIGAVVPSPGTPVDPAALLRLAVDASVFAADGELGAVVLLAEAYESATGAAARIDGERAVVISNMPRECALMRSDRYDESRHVLCDHCDYLGIDLSDWLGRRLAPPCTLDELAEVWNFEYCEDCAPEELADEIRNELIDRDVHSVALAHDALAGDDRAVFAAALGGAPPPGVQRRYFEPGHPREGIPSSSDIREMLKKGRWYVLGGCSVAAAIRGTSPCWGDPDMMSDLFDSLARFSEDFPGDTLDFGVRFDPAWPPAEIRARARRVAAGRLEHHRRRAATLRRNLAAVARTRAATAAAARLLRPERAAAAWALFRSW